MASSYLKSRFSHKTPCWRVFQIFLILFKVAYEFPSSFLGNGCIPAESWEVVIWFGFCFTFCSYRDGNSCILVWNRIELNVSWKLNLNQKSFPPSIDWLYIWHISLLLELDVLLMVGWISIPMQDVLCRAFCYCPQMVGAWL